MYTLVYNYKYTDRYSQIKYNTENSPIFPVYSGVPQGSVLSPLLYLIFTADIPTRNDTIISTFADDTALMASTEDPPSCVPKPSNSPHST